MSPITRPRLDEVLVFESADAFRDWMEANHDAATEAWIGYYRNGVPKQSQSYADAVDVALCYGWIDGVAYRIDDEVTANRFTPRRPGSNWSAVNIDKVERLKREGRMRPAGLAAYEGRHASADARAARARRPPDLPDAMRATLDADPAARAYWEAQTPSYRRTAADWVVSAKREETRQRRLRQLIADCAAERPIRLLAHDREPSTGS